MRSQVKRPSTRLMFLVGFTLAATGFLPIPDRAWEVCQAWSAGDGVHVLFIGNSFTFTHDVPGMLAQLSQAKKDGPAIIVSSQVYPNATLEGHWERGEAIHRIHERAWDFVVLQEQSYRPIGEFPLMQEYARRFAEEIRDSGATTLLYLTWADLDRPSEQRQLNAAYGAMAQELGAQIVPVGPAWARALWERPAVRLHADDEHHPSVTGAYLSACVFYAAITGVDPLGLPCEVSRKPRQVWQLIWPGRRMILSRDTASFLQGIAGETLLGQVYLGQFTFARDEPLCALIAPH